MNRSYSKIRHIQEANQRLENRLLSEQSTTSGATTQPFNAFTTLYSNGFNKIETPFLGSWYQNQFKFGNVVIGPLKSLANPKSDVQIKMVLKYVPTMIEKGLESWPEDREKFNVEKLKKYKQMSYVVYDGQNNELMSFNPPNNDEQYKYIFNTTTNKLINNKDEFINDIKIK